MERSSSHCGCSTGHYCGYFNGNLHRMKVKKSNKISDSMFRKCKGLNFLVQFDLDFKTTSSFCLSHGKLYYLNTDNHLMEYTLRESPKKIDLVLGEGRKISKVFVEPVHESLILLIISMCRVGPSQPAPFGPRKGVHGV